MRPTVLWRCVFVEAAGSSETITMSRAPQTVHVLSLTARRRPGAAEILEGVFEELGIDPRRVAVEEKSSDVQLNIYLDSLPSAKALINRLDAWPRRAFRTHHTTIKKDAWVHHRRDDFRPIPLSREWFVVPVHDRAKKYPKTLEPIFLNINMSFGTGLHETTRLMADFIRSCRGKFDSFLDVGTGAGLLAVLAFKCRARCVWAIDRDGVSIREARQNLKLNHLACRRLQKADFKTWRCRRKFDFVAANLLTDDLVALSGRLSACVREGKYLAVSGIGLENLKRVKAAFRQHALRCRRVRRQREWAAILYQKMGRASA